MPERLPPDLDLLPDGSFREPSRPSIGAQIFRWAVIVAVLATVLAVAALALWFALLLIPLAIAAALVAWLAFRFQLWRTGKSATGQWTIRRGRF